MTNYTLSADAEQDVVGIYLYSIEKFGLAQADKYVSEMYGHFSIVGNDHTKGKSCDEVAPGLRRFRYVSHVIYYRPADTGVFILRILHGSMDPGRHL